MNAELFMAWETEVAQKAELSVSLLLTHTCIIVSVKQFPKQSYVDMGLQSIIALDSLVNEMKQKIPFDIYYNTTLWVSGILHVRCYNVKSEINICIIVILGFVFQDLLIRGIVVWFTVVRGTVIWDNAVKSNIIWGIVIGGNVIRGIVFESMWFEALPFKAMLFEALFF